MSCFSRARRTSLPWFVLALCASAAAHCCRADIRLPHLLSSGMMLQRDKPVRFWGWADPQEKVDLQLGGKSVAHTAADERGEWELTLPPQAAGAVPDITVQGKNTLTLTDLLAGDVWICSGQSNMAFPLSRSSDAQNAVAGSTNPQLRLFKFPNHGAPAPSPDVDGSWVASSPESAASFSAVGYYFGKRLQSDLKVPIGLIESAWPGSSIESWLPRAVLEANPETENLPRAADTYRKRFAMQSSAAGPAPATPKETEASSPAPGNARARRPLPAPDDNPAIASTLYNTMVYPLRFCTVKGGLWYQGEANRLRAAQYGVLLPMLIDQWRGYFGADFAWGIVQLPNFSLPDADFQNTSWAEMRDVQKSVARQKGCGLIVTIDVGEPTNLHPKNKAAVGERAAAWALANVYHRDAPFSGPVYQRMTVEGDKVRVFFDHANGGLISKRGPVTAVEIATADRHFVPAEAQIDGDTLLVHAAGVAQPVAVRYAWTDNPDARLFNKDGLPASPFRTDDWPLISSTRQGGSTRPAQTSQE